MASSKSLVDRVNGAPLKFPEFKPDTIVTRVTRTEQMGDVLGSALVGALGGYVVDGVRGAAIGAAAAGSLAYYFTPKPGVHVRALEPQTPATAENTVARALDAAGTTAVVAGIYAIPSFLSGWTTRDTVVAGVLAVFVGVNSYRHNKEYVKRDA